MYLLINIVGLFAFVGVGYLLSKDRRNIHWRCVIQLFAFNVLMAGFLNMSSVGREFVRLAAEGVAEFTNIAFVGVGFALPNWVNVPPYKLFAETISSPSAAMFVIVK